MSERDYDAEGQGVVVGRGLPAKILPVSKQPDIKAAFARHWREKRKRDPEWVARERERARSYSGTKRRKKQDREASKRHRAKLRRLSKEAEARELEKFAAEYRRSIGEGAREKYQRLVAEEVRKIEDGLRRGVPKRELARLFGVARTSIDWIQKKMTGGRR